MRTPERAVWPLPPRPPVLPVPEPMPRPMRERFLRAPGRSESSCSFIAWSSFCSWSRPAAGFGPLADGRYEPPAGHDAYFYSLPTTRRRCWIFAIMPRVCGVSGTSAVRPIRLSLSPIRVSRWEWCRRMGLPICWILITLSDLLMSASRLGSPKDLLGDLFGIALAAARLQGRDFDVAPRGDRARRILTLERIEGRPHHVIGVGRSHRFRHHVLHAERFEHRAHRSAGDDAG